jgi:prepilin-type N-terminal cleavage/methylation domain-containing protein
MAMTRTRGQRGMTLVELMVTMIIASIVAASTFVFFAGQQRVYETQTKLLNVQQNAWAAMEVLSRFVRSNGSGMYGCVRPVGGGSLSNPTPGIATTPLTRTPEDANDASDDPPVVVPLIRNLSQTPNAGLRAFRAGQMIRIPPLWIVDNVDPTDPSTAGMVAGTDVITVAFGNRSSGTTFDSALQNAYAATGAAITVPPANGVMFQASEFVVLIGEPNPGLNNIISDIGCTLFQVTSVPAGTGTLNLATHATITCAPGDICNGSRWNPTGVVAAMVPGTGYGVPTPAVNPTTNLNTGVRNFGDLWWVRFAIRTADSAGNGITNYGATGVAQTIPVLTMERLDGTLPTSPVVLAEGIEDLQVAFACDTNVDGLLTEGPSTTDEWLLNDPNDAIPLNRAQKCNQPTAVRLTLVARSLTEDTGINAALTNNRRPAVENRAAGAFDQFRRRVLTTTIYPRNN